jgi:phosphatidylglycerophosphatase A
MKRIFTSCFGLGLLPLAPGTWGSLPPAIIFSVMGHFGVSAGPIAITMAALVLAGSVICVLFAPAIITATGKDDPREVVIDEFAGQALTFLPAAFLITASISLKKICIITALGFLFFRLFDVVKPWPIRKLEKLSKGWGILTDDLLAGVFAAIVVLVCYWFWIADFGA